MQRLLATSILSLAIVLARCAPLSAHGLEMFVGSSAPGSGALRIDYEFTDKVPLPKIITLGGTSFYSDIYPGFEWITEDQPAKGLFALKVGTQLTMQIVAIAAPVSVTLNGTTLTAAGETGFIAATTSEPDDHVHPQWQLTLPEGVSGDYAISFKVTTTTLPYTASSVYTLTLTNAALSPTSTTLPRTATPTPPTTPAPTATATASAPPGVTPGDANCDGVVSAADIPVELVLLDSHEPLPSCGADVVNDGRIDRRDLAALIERLFEPLAVL